jgi:hypothetical protein
LRVNRCALQMICSVAWLDDVVEVRGVIDSAFPPSCERDVDLVLVVLVNKQAKHDVWIEQADVVQASCRVDGEGVGSVPEGVLTDDLGAIPRVAPLAIWFPPQREPARFEKPPPVPPRRRVTAAVGAQMEVEDAVVVDQGVIRRPMVRTRPETVWKYVRLHVPLIVAENDRHTRDSQRAVWVGTLAR